MKRKQIKLLSTCLSASMLLTVIPVSADFEISNITNGNSDEYVDYQSSDEEDFSTETSVYALIGSNYKVTIPKVIILSGIEKKANYYVDVTGDIAGVEKVNVVPDESVELFSANKASQIASIAQDRTSWGYEDLGTKANGLVEASVLTSGKWSGTFNFNINLEGNENGQVLGDLVLPDEGTTLSDMTFKQIQAVAKEGKTTDYNIKVGDTIKINDSIDAEIISIGDNYIEFMTIQRVVSDGTPETKSTLKNGNNVTSNGPAAFYKYPQVNYEGKSNSEEISYVNSDIKKKVETWFSSQSDEFKSVIKNTEREYEVATLTFNGSKYSEAITSTITDIEKVYIPTKTELEKIYTISANHKSDMFWTATPCAFSNSPYAGRSFGVFFSGAYGIVKDSRGDEDYGTVALFRIG